MSLPYRSTRADWPDLPLESWSDTAATLHMWSQVGTASSPDEFLLEFLQSTYEAAADRAGWDRAAMERELVPKQR